MSLKQLTWTGTRLLCENKAWLSFDWKHTSMLL